jgi:transcriptional regulator with PAS, ATPase and Fis domain
VQDFPAAVTVCDADGVILEMNNQAALAFASSGGRTLLGSNVLDCHPEPARSKLTRLLDTQQTNMYTVERKGLRKLIFQAPWYRDGQFGGLVELTLELPDDIPHFVRDV